MSEIVLAMCWSALSAMKIHGQWCDEVLGWILARLHPSISGKEATEYATLLQRIAHESTKRCMFTPQHVESDQTSTGRPVTVDQKEEHHIDFQSARTVTLSCKGSRTPPSSRACTKDRNSSSSSSTSSRLAPE